MSRSPYRVPQERHRLTRRRVLALTATGVGVSAVSVAGLSLAGESNPTSDGSALVISVRDAHKGTMDVFFGEGRKTITDKKLAASLLKAAGR